MKIIRGVICGSFDVIHPGYTRMFRDAKENACNHLIVALQDDPTIDRPEKCKPVQSFNDRREILQSIRYIDDIVEYSTEKELFKLLSTLDYDIRILGTDYRGKHYTGIELKKPVYYHVRNHDYSTTSLKRSIYNSMRDKIESIDS
jgi:glycerol-3-phosphate cytidylyltransferase